MEDSSKPDPSLTCQQITVVDAFGIYDRRARFDWPWRARLIGELALARMITT
jgi:hypothetical protein